MSDSIEGRAARPVPAGPADGAGKLRQTQAEYCAARPASSIDKKRLTATKMYVCRRCQANFRTGEGQPDLRIPGLGRCLKCLPATAPAAP